MFDPFKHLRGEVPAYLQELLAIEKKAALESFCRTIEITQHDLCMLIFNSEGIGYAHDIQHHEFRPSHLEPTDEEVASMQSHSTGEDRASLRRKFVRKISQIFKERRLFVAHTFFNSERWHAFYFDQRDRSAEPGNHWKGGAHLHFVNHLWPEYDLGTFWRSTNEDNPKFRGSLHITYKPDADEGLPSSVPLP